MKRRSAVHYHRFLVTGVHFYSARQGVHFCSAVYNVQLTQGLAVVEGVCPDQEVARQLCRKIIEDTTLVKAELSSLLFIYEALLKTDIKYLQFVLQDIRDKYGSMLKKGATSLWETIDGAEAFSRAGSLCHGWSSIFNYIAGAYILGIKPLEPGFRKYTTTPAMDLIPFAMGVIPTASGDIHVSWDSATKKGSLIINVR